MNLIYFIMLMVCFFPGCRRYYEWGKKFFIQAEPRSIQFCHARSYHGYAHLYHGFETVGMFDILWLSDEVYDWYYEQIQRRYGLGCKALDDIRHNQSDNRTCLIEFYLLMTHPDDMQLFPQLAVDVNSEWSAVFAANDKEYQAREIKTVDLNPEFRELFCEYQSPYQLVEEAHFRYRNIYRVSFSRFDVEGSDLLAEGNTVRFILRSTKYEVMFTWHPESYAWVITHKDKCAENHTGYCSGS